MKFFSLFTIHIFIFYYYFTIDITFAIYKSKIKSHNITNQDQRNESTSISYSSTLKTKLDLPVTLQNVYTEKTDRDKEPTPNLVLQDKFLDKPLIIPSSGHKCGTDINSYELLENEKNYQKTSRLYFDLIDLYDESISYPLNTTYYKIVRIPARTSLKVVITAINDEISDFLVVQAHSQKNNIVLSVDRQPVNESFVNNTNAGLVIFITKYENSSSSDKTVYAINYHDQDLSILLFVRNYTDREPIPGGLFGLNSTLSIPHPYLLVKQNLLTTLISFPLSSIFNSFYVPKEDNATVIPSSLSSSSFIKYEIYLTYMYEGDLYEEHLFQTIIKTSTVKGLHANAVKVSEISDIQFASKWIEELFVSYSGVGTVINVIASYNGSEGVLYSSTVFYGCDFIEEEKYDCTKLVSSFAKLFCASLLFIGIILLFLGHRWLNFTMFISGFLASWFILFVIFVQIPEPNMEVLGFFTLMGAIGGGIGWLVLWHKFHRPFYSALLIILISSFFAAMISTHFLKYALVPTQENLAVFILFPILFSAAIIGYSIFDIKNIHVFSCCLLGSYGVVVPFAFYFGSSLTYIVINVLSAMTVRRFSQTVGFPPFQYCDIAILCVWILLFILGIGYQVYRERSGPPFYPPNVSVFKAVLSALNLVKEKLMQCVGRQTTANDDDSLFEDRPCFLTRLFSRFRSESSGDSHSTYESFPRIGSDDDNASCKEILVRPFRNTYEYILQVFTRSRQSVSSDVLREPLNCREAEDDPLERGYNSRETGFEGPVRV